jgi:hypothetical protein
MTTATLPAPAAAPAATPPVPPTPQDSDFVRGIHAGNRGECSRFLSPEQRESIVAMCHLAELTLYRPGRLLRKLKDDAPESCIYNEADALRDRLALLVKELRAIQEQLPRRGHLLDGTLPFTDPPAHAASRAP